MAGQPIAQPALIATPHATVSVKTEPMTIDLTLDDEETISTDDRFHAYRQFLSAVLSSLAFSLASKEGYTPLNTRTLVSPSSLPPVDPLSMPEKPVGIPGSMGTSALTIPEIIPPVLIAIEAYMTSTGTLLVTPYPEKQPAIRRLTTCRLANTCLENREVFLAPWGEWGRLVPLSEQDKVVEPLSRQEYKWRGLVLSYLRDLGLISSSSGGQKTALHQAIEMDEWRTVEVWLQNSDTGTGELYRVLWPSTLLFLRASESDKRQRFPDEGEDEFWIKLFDDPLYTRLAEGKLATSLVTLEGAVQRVQDLGVEWWDVESALVSVQEWAKDRPEREKAAARIEEQRKKQEQDRIKKGEEGKPPPMDEKKLKIPDVKNDNGVYPTPPDAATGTAVPLSGTSIAPEEMLEPVLLETSEMDMDWPGVASGLPAIRKGSDLAVPPTRVGREADLFCGEMDEEMELFEQGMGVTEDDFNFFDQQPMDAFSGDDMDMNMNMGEIDMGTVSNDPEASIDLPEKNPVILAGLPQHTPAPKPDAQVRTPPLSPHRAIRLLVPGYSPPEPLPNGIGPTPPTSGSMKTPSTAASLPPSAESQRKMSVYAPIAFTESVELADRKYAPGGRFFLPPEDIKEQDVTELPTQMERLELLGINRIPILKRKRHPDPLNEIESEIEVDNNTDIGSGSETESSDADDTTNEDEYAPYSTSPTQLTVPPFLSRKRKRPPEDDGEVAISETMRRDAAIEIDGDTDIAPLPQERMMPDFAEASLVGVFERPTVESEPLTLHSLGQSDFVSVAGIVSEQMFGWVNSGWDGRSETRHEDEDNERSWKLRQRSLIDILRVEDAVKYVFQPTEVERCTLESYAHVLDAVPDLPPLPPPSSLPPRPAMRPNPTLSRRQLEKQTTVFALPPPHVHLHRADQALEILPPALSFWETFGLGPCSGSKNVVAFCVHPASSSLAEGADFLLDRIGNAYEAGRFGAHVRANLGDIVTAGLVPVELPNSASRTYEAGISALLATMETLGTFIAHGVADEGLNIVVYVLNPFSHDNAIVDLAFGFTKLCRAYELSLPKFNTRPNHLVLQIVPASFAASKKGPVLRVNVWHHLALEVYGRCIPEVSVGLGKQTNNINDRARTPSPAITLGRKLPSKLDFRLSADPAVTGVSLFRENSVLHIAYSQTLDERWVSVAWTDNAGELSKTTLINLSRKGSASLRLFSDVLAEIWHNTAELLSQYPHRWRLAVTRLDSMPADEVEMWKAVSHPKVLAVIILAANLNPPVRIEKPPPGADGEEIDIRGFWPTTASYSTPPAPTPTPGAPTPTGFVSPDAFGNAANTPGTAAEEGFDPDAMLAEKADDTWGIVLAHSWPARGDEEGLGNIEKAHACGILVRACKVIAAVSVMHTGDIGTGDVVAREALEWWRGLGVLARCRGGGGLGVPWHLAAVAGVERLGRVM